MKVDWKYDVLFSFAVSHPAAPASDFSVRPTVACGILLRRLGMFFKPVDNGGLIITEKRIQEDGSAIPLRTLKELTAFTFQLKTSNPNVLNRTKPFDAALQAFNGRRRIVYLDNLGVGNVLDSDLIPVTQTTPSDTDLNARPLPKNGGLISLADLASTVPSKFSFLVADPTNNQVKVTAIRPSPPAPAFINLTGATRRVDLELAEGAYQLEQLGGASTLERVYADDQLLSQNCLGFICIYKDASLDFNLSIRYDINFENA